jgi:hypothetical protein
MACTPASRLGYTRRLAGPSLPIGRIEQPDTKWWGAIIRAVGSSGPVHRYRDRGIGEYLLERAAESVVLVARKRLARRMLLTG